MVALSVAWVVDGGTVDAAGTKSETVMPEKVINKIPDNVTTHTITISGQAQDATGKPIAGATIYVASHND